MINFDIGLIVLLRLTVLCSKITTIFSFVTCRRSTIVQQSVNECRTPEEGSKLYVSTLDEVLGNDFIQAIQDTSTIGLPLAGLGVAFALSKFGVNQRNELRLKVEQVQLTLVKKSEEAAIAGYTSTVSLNVFRVRNQITVSFLTIFGKNEYFMERLFL
jgi:hypothetical protein